jgi:pimeloyl-ACP methyl ester carboxylesterase
MTAVLSIMTLAFVTSATAVASLIASDVRKFLPPRRQAQKYFSSKPLIPDFGDCSIFSVSSTDGVDIHGCVIRPERTVPRGVIIVCHGWGLSKDRTTVHAHWLVERGFTAILFDFRACGTSGNGGGILPEPLDHGLRDLDAVLRLVAAKLPEATLGISVVGYSYGGNVALAHAGSAVPSYRCLILDSTPVVRHRSFIKTCLLRAYGNQPVGRLTRLRVLASSFITSWLLRGGRFYSAAIASCRRLRDTPILYIVGEKEDFFPLSEAHQFLDTHCAGTVTRFVASKGRHLTNHISDAAGYWAALDRHLTTAHPVIARTETPVGLAAN